jgi:hypothetical protein
MNSYPSEEKRSDTMRSKPHNKKILGMENEGMETTSHSKKNENPPTKTIKNDREPLWLPILRMTDNSVTSNFIAKNKTPMIHSRKSHQIT